MKKIPPLEYTDWIRLFDSVDVNDQQKIERQLISCRPSAVFHILVYAIDGAGSDVRRTLDSLCNQRYPNINCTIFGGAAQITGELVDGLPVSVISEADMDDFLSTFGESIANRSNWIMRIRAGDILHPDALFEFAMASATQTEVVAMYSDEDALDAYAVRVDPRFKPEWSLAHLRATNYLGDAVALRGDMLVAVGGLNESMCRHGFFDRILQVIDLKNENIIHLPAVLLHKGSKVCPDAAAWEMHAVQRHLVRRGIPATVSPTMQGCRRVRYQLPASLPLVSIIIPTRDAVELLRRCVDSILNKTTYARYEIVVVDNQSSDPAALAYLREIAAHPAVRVLPFDRPFNFSAINNFAAGEARGELLCLLNNDTEVITPDWLDEMVGHLLQDHVGVVGAKLFYPDGRVQHAGDTVGPGGCANHLHNGIARDDPGYCNRAVVAQDLSAVTAACLLTRRDLYLELGGLDARWLRVAFNDVDYCLRVRAAGWKVIWTPHAELYHHESVSRGKNDNWRKILRSELEVAVMRRRWKHVMRNDPFYNPNLNYRQPDFTPGRTRRVKRPWD